MKGKRVAATDILLLKYWIERKSEDVKRVNNLIL